jgi:hypothetical protein
VRTYPEIVSPETWELEARNLSIAQKQIVWKTARGKVLSQKTLLQKHIIAKHKGRSGESGPELQEIPVTSTRYSVDSISKPQASSKGSGIYFEFLLRRAHSLSRVDRRY